MVVSILDYGGLVTHLKVPDKNGLAEDIVLGYDNLDGYLKATPYFGAIVGRYGNRIAKGKFALDGSVIAGPPPRPLDHMEYKIDNGGFQLIEAAARGGVKTSPAVAGTPSPPKATDPSSIPSTNHLKPTGTS